MERKFEKYISQNEDYKFVIEEDLPDFGWYLYVYENDRIIYDCLNDTFMNEDGRCIYDYLQDSLLMCKEFALEDFNVPLDSWEREYE